MEWIQVLTIIASIGGIVLTMGVILFWVITSKNDSTNKRFDDFKADIKEDLKAIKTELKRVVETLISKRILKPLTENYMKQESPLEITESGQNFLKKNNVEDLLSKCDLIKKDFKDASGFEVFRQCLEWVQDPKNEDGKTKVLELLYNSELSKEKAQRLLALAIRDKILKK